MKKVPVYRGDYNNCRLCLEDKLSILEYAEPNELLNKHSELNS